MESDLKTVATLPQNTLQTIFSMETWSWSHVWGDRLSPRLWRTNWKLSAIFNFQVSYVDSSEPLALAIHVWHILNPVHVKVSRHSRLTINLLSQWNKIYFWDSQRNIYSKFTCSLFKLSHTKYLNRFFCWRWITWALQQAVWYVHSMITI